MDKNTIIRTIVALIVAILDVLKLFGIEIGADADGIYAVVTVVVGAWIWWKNNNFTVEAITAQKLLNELKEGRKKVTPDAEEPIDSEVE